MTSIGMNTQLVDVFNFEHVLPLAKFQLGVYQLCMSLVIFVIMVFYFN